MKNWQWWVIFLALLIIVALEIWFIAEFMGRIGYATA